MCYDIGKGEPNRGNELLSELVITRVSSVSTMYTPKGTKMKRNGRTCWALVLKYEGETVYTSGGKRFTSNLHRVVLLPKGCVYDWECTDSGHFTIIEFESTLSLKEPISLPVKHSEQVKKMFLDLEYKRNLQRPLLALESIRDVYSILLYVKGAETGKYTASEQQNRLLPALEYISRNYATHITNDALAALTGMSTVYFRKLFGAVMGISPIAYVKQIRIEKAKEMLESDFGTLSDVAQSLGYGSLYDFSRDFKKHVGVAPSRYAKRR